MVQMTDFIVFKGKMKIKLNFIAESCRRAYRVKWLWDLRKNWIFNSGELHVVGVFNTKNRILFKSYGLVLLHILVISEDF